MQVGQVRKRGDPVDRLIFRGYLGGIRRRGSRTRRIASLGNDLGGITLHHLGECLRRHRADRHRQSQTRGNGRVDMPSVHVSSRHAQRTKQHWSDWQVKLSVSFANGGLQYATG